MKHFSLNLEAISPLAIRSDHATGGANSAAYISGTALAGSLASVYRLYHPGDGKRFEELFLSGQVQYPDLYPAMFRPNGMHNAINYPVYSLPKTAQSCKRFPGFTQAQGDESDDPEDEPHGIRDSLLDWAAFKIALQAQKNGLAIDATTLLSPLQAQKKCWVPGCEKPMDHISGFYRRDSANGQMAKASNVTRLQTHTGINRDTGTVQEGILYNRQVFVEHTLFWGMVKLPEQLSSPFQTFIKEVGQSGLVRIGTGRTRGMGKVNLEVEPLEKELENEQDRFEQFKQRLRSFNVTLHARMKEEFPANADDLGLQPFYFALTLHSPVILCDDMLRYYGSIDTSVLAKYLPLLTNNLKLVYQAASTRRISGWNELWGLPRLNEYAIDTGSVFVFGSDIAPDEEQDNALWQALFTLEEEGIGRRRGEGYGRVSVSDSFHSEAVLSKTMEEALP